MKIIAIPAKDSDTGRDELYIEIDGIRIAKRGQPDTAHARTWIPLRPGYRVTDDVDRGEIIVEHVDLQ
jgi:hypothetical protein